MHVHPRVYACIINETTKGKFPGEYHVVWIGEIRACLHGGGRPQEGEVARLCGVTHLSI